MEYERPSFLRGVHFGPGTSAGFDIGWWVQFLKSMHVGWIKIVDDAGSMMEFAAACRAAGIMPIVRLYRQFPNPGMLRDKDWVALKEYLRRGITRWFETNNEPNLWDPEWHPDYRPSWEEGDPAVFDTLWFKYTAIPMIMQYWLVEAEKVIGLGGYPAFPSMAQCGFHPVCGSIPIARAMFNYLQQYHLERTRAIWENGGWLSVHDATLNHFYNDGNTWHFEYPYDPNCQSRHPGKTILDDDNSLIGHEAPRDMITNRWGLRVPIISTEGGVFLDVGTQWDRNYPGISSAEYHGQGTLAMFDWLDEYQKTHQWFFGMCPWIVAGQVLGHPTNWEAESWKKVDREEPVIRYLQNSPPRDLNVPVPSPAPIPTPTPTPIPEVTLKAFRQDGSAVEPTILLNSYRVTITPCDGPGYRIVEIRERCEAANCDVWVRDAAGNPIPDAAVRWGWPGTEIMQRTDPYGRTGFAMAASAKYDPNVGPGPHWTAVASDSERVDGIGMIMGTVHCTLNFVFRFTEAGAVPAPEPTPTPTPEPPPASTGFYAKFPRPPKDNGLGMHFGLGGRLVGAALSEDIARARALRVTWATVAFGAGEDVMLAAAKALYAAGIMPIVRKVLNNIDGKYDFARDARLLLDNGIPAYIQIFNEPSDDREWANGRPADYRQRWAGLWAQKAGEVVASGGFPGLQCLHPDELSAVFAVLPRESYIWDYVWFCSHNYGLNHPPSWKGDYWSVLGWEMFATMFRDYLGLVPPIICGEGGWLWKASNDSNFPMVDDALHAKYHKEMYEWFRTGTLSDGQSLPEYLFAVCPWILSGPSDEAWYGFTERTVTINAVKSIPEFVRAAAGPEVPPEPDVPEEPEEPEPVPTDRAAGFDVSSHQGTIDWAKAAVGKDFVYIRASAGLTPDSQFQRNQAEAKDRGLLRGAYHFLRSDASAAEQAKLFKVTIGTVGPELLPMLDVETYSGMPNLTAAQIKEFVATFGMPLGAYTSVWAWNDGLHLGADPLGLQPLWVAHSTVAGQPRLPLAWTAWEFHQHTAAGTVGGIVGPVDLDVFNGTAEQLRQKYTGSSALGVIMPMAVKRLRGIPLPANYALVAAAVKAGYPIQLPDYGRTDIGGIKYDWQIFTRAQQDRYVVAYCAVGDWQNVKVAVIVRG